MRFFYSLLNFAKGAIILYLSFLFLQWYIKGHIGKHYYWFWLNTILSAIMFYNHHSNPGADWPQYEDIN